MTAVIKPAWAILFVPLVFMYFYFNPDIDLTIEVDILTKGETMAHRLLYTHSILFPALFAWCVAVIVDQVLLLKYNIDIVIFDVGFILFKFFQIPVLIHLFFDVNLDPKTWRGTYCLVYFPHKRLSGRVSTAWLASNITLGILVYFW